MSLGSEGICVKCRRGVRVLQGGRGGSEGFGRAGQGGVGGGLLCVWCSNALAAEWGVWCRPNGTESS